MKEKKELTNKLKLHKKEYFKLKIPFGDQDTKNFPKWLKEIILLSYNIGSKEIEKRIKEYEQNHKFDNGYTNYLGVYYLKTVNKKTYINSAIHPKIVWIASLNGLFERVV